MRHRHVCLPTPSTWHKLNEIFCNCDFKLIWSVFKIVQWLSQFQSKPNVGGKRFLATRLLVLHRASTTLGYTRGFASFTGEMDTRRLGSQFGMFIVLLFVTIPGFDCRKPKKFPLIEDKVEHKQSRTPGKNFLLHIARSRFVQIGRHDVLNIYLCCHKYQIGQTRNLRYCLFKRFISNVDASSLVIRVVLYKDVNFNSRLSCYLFH